MDNDINQQQQQVSDIQIANQQLIQEVDSGSIQQLELGVNNIALFYTFQEQQLIITKINQIIYSLRFLQLYTFSFMALSFSLTLYLIIRKHIIQPYLIIVSIQYTIHFIFITKPLLTYANLFKLDIQLGQNSPLILLYFTQLYELNQSISFFNIFQFLLKMRNLIYKVNTLFFITSFVLGIINMYNTFIPKWYRILSIIPPLLIVSYFTILILLFFIALPFIICYLLTHRNHTIRQQQSTSNFQLPPSKSFDSSYPNDQPCYICLQEYNQSENITVLPCKAKHFFHTDCIQPWADLHDHCPICRQILN